MTDFDFSNLIVLRTISFFRNSEENPSFYSGTFVKFEFLVYEMLLKQELKPSLSRAIRFARSHSTS